MSHLIPFESSRRAAVNGAIENPCDLRKVLSRTILLRKIWEPLGEIALAGWQKAGEQLGQNAWRAVANQQVMVV